jgi:uncharacterized Tic20 family protein
MSEPYIPPTDAPAAVHSPPPLPPSAQLSQRDERLWAMGCHLSSLAMYLAIPFANILGPFIVWSIQRDKSPLVDDQGKEAVNFQITMTIAFAVAIVLAISVIGLIVAIPLLAVLPVIQILFTVLAAIKANEGVAYRYPLTIRFIK